MFSRIFPSSFLLYFYPNFEPSKMFAGSVFDVSVLVLVIYFFFSKRFSKMVDVLTARFQNQLGNLLNGDSVRSRVSEPQDLFDASNLPHIARLAREKHKQEQLKKRELANKISSKQLLNIKEKEWGVFLANTKSNVGLSCSACTPDSRESFKSKDDRTAMLKNVLTMRDPSKDSGWLAYYFNHIYALCSSTHHDYPSVSETVLNSDQIQEAIELSAHQMLEDEGVKEPDEQFYQKVINKNAQRAAAILRGMQTTVNNLVFKIVGWFAYKILSRAFSGMVMHPSQIKMLEAAKARGLPIVYLPLHRSHLDYITVALLLQCIDFKAPLVAAGDNLKVPILEWALRNNGAFFIKRRIDPVTGRKDILYRAILCAYMTECLKAGYHLEFFIEGGRTRTGKPVIPKGGLLSIIVDAYFKGTIEDALLVPISINYDRLVDGNFTREQLGEPKQPETLWGTISAIFKTITSFYGLMRVDFNQPFSLKELVKSFERQMSSTNKGLHVLRHSSSFHGTVEVSEDQRQLVNSIATHIVYDCCQYMPVMSTNAVSFLLLTKFRNGVELQELAKELDNLRQILEWDNRNIGFTGSSSFVIQHAVKLLGPELVEQNQSSNDTAIIKPVLALPSIIELSYYSNTLVPHFIMPGVVATALCSLLKEQFETARSQGGNSSRPTTTQLDLLQHSLKLCDILQFEFIFTKPCQYLDTIVIQTIEQLATLDILAVKQELLMEEEQWSQRFARRLEEEDEYDDYGGDEYDVDLDDNPSVFNIGNKITYEISLSSESIKHLDFYRNIVAPFIESYSTSAKCLESLAGSQNQEQAHVKSVLGEIKTQLSQGKLKFNECAAVDQIKNSLKLFEKWSVLESFTQDKIKILYLTEEYDDKANLEPIIERIMCFR
ncbi:unnamed protein product [Bemisia tabaci]|uniref:Phospholipid/glycerol acyltransferase domain-containing protein n=2 Tax=Bemisia tabaci TaxID=7038 RepID=A0A9P0ACP0_BEMTA|nr:unnamed protein product [Bemisia tabaci]